MNRLTVSSVALIMLHSALSVLANVKITPIAVENKSNLKSDLKVEEARYQNPLGGIMPEYYGSSYDRNRQNFVTGSSYGGSPYGTGLSSYDRYGGSSGGGYNSMDRYGSNYDRYGTSQWSNRDRTGISKFEIKKIFK
jgi:hypothetical protein